MNHSKISSQDNLPLKISQFVNSLRSGEPGEFLMSPGGIKTLYASCFAAMTLHYVAQLELSLQTRNAWANYILKWQDKQTGYFIGPELVKTEITHAEHNWDVVRMHLAVHVLPALAILGTSPKYPLTFAHPFLEQAHLQRWLESRDWERAWLEGNNLLFVGQFLLHLRDIEQMSNAQAALDFYFEWLDKQIDPRTGLWGTQGQSTLAHAVYGAYHQLLLYFGENRPLAYPERLVDSVLQIQEWDGGFSDSGKGGACEDIDAISILANLYQRYDYKRPLIQRALQKAYRSVKRRMIATGGFVYRWDESFIHMSIPRTFVPPNTPHLFATWFGTHTMAVLAQVLMTEPSLSYGWQFNPTVSMGWHMRANPIRVRSAQPIRRTRLFALGAMQEMKQLARAERRRFRRVRYQYLPRIKHRLKQFANPIIGASSG